MGISGSNLVRVVSGLMLLLLAVLCVGAMDAGEVEQNWAAKQQCSGSIGECFQEEEEMGMDSESNRRSLVKKKFYISWQAMSRNNVPCSKRGFSYYNCGRTTLANPYTRGCTKITRCDRDTG